MATQATCPICEQTYPLKDINTHIDSCLSDGPGTLSSAPDEAPKDKTQTKSNQKRKRNDECSVPASDDDQEQPQKRSAWGSLCRSPANSTKGITTKASTSMGSLDMKNPKKFVPSSSSTKSQKSSSSTEIPQNHSSSNFATSVASSSAQTRQTKPKVDFRPLAERMRPKQLDGYIGQNKAVGKDSMLRRLLEADNVPSMILWGPPGCGKTTLASIISQKSKQKNAGTRFVSLSATTSNVAQVKDVITVAKNEQKMFKRKTILFVDEIHRFNKLQQDAFLPHVENGSIILIGATTENPSFKVNSALLSRCRVVVLDKLSVDDLTSIIERALSEIGVEILEEDSTSNGNEEDEGRNPVYIERYAITTLANLCDGDARAALNAVQMTVQSQSASHKISGSTSASGSNKVSDWSNGGDDSDEAPTGERCVITTDHVKEGLQRSHIQYDRAGDEHFNCISALHKSMRGCDANAALYWMSRMLLGGEDPLYVARRLIEFASADIGLADPQALVQAVSTFQACQFLGMPVCQINLAQCVTYLCKAPKSNLVETVNNRVKQCIEEHEGPMPGVPLHLRNASTPLMKQLGYGKGYNPTTKQEYMPEGLEGVDFFQGTEYEFS